MSEWDSIYISSNERMSLTNNWTNVSLLLNLAGFKQYVCFKVYFCILLRSYNEQTLVTIMNEIHNRQKIEKDHYACIWQYGKLWT